MQQALEIIVGGLLQGGAFALVALGFALIYRVTGMLNLAQGAFVIARRAVALHVSPSAVVAARRWRFWHRSLISVIIGTVLAQFVLEPALRKLPPGGSIMITAGLLTFFEGAILLTWGSQPYQLDPFTGSRPYDIGGILFPTQAPWDAGATRSLIVAAMWYVLQKTRFGMALRACSENHAAAALMGIDVRRMTIASFAAAAGHRRDRRHADRTDHLARIQRRRHLLDVRLHRASRSAAPRRSSVRSSADSGSA